MASPAKIKMQIRLCCIHMTNYYYGGYHHINKIGEFLQFSSKRKGIRAWNFRIKIRKIWQFLWYQNRNNFEKMKKRKDQAPLTKLNKFLYAMYVVSLHFCQTRYVKQLTCLTNVKYPQYINLSNKFGHNFRIDLAPYLP